MTLKDLFLRVKDTTGLEVLTVSDMYTMYRNCAADLTSRGYREFAEMEILPFDEEAPVVEGQETFVSVANKKMKMKMPDGVRKILYLKLDDGAGLHKGTRIPATHAGIDTVKYGQEVGEYFFDFNTDSSMNYVYYVKGDDLYFEIGTNANPPKKLVMGYNKKIPTDIIPEVWTYSGLDEEGNPAIISSTDVYDPGILEHIELPIRKDLQEVFVFFGVYFVYNKRLKEESMIQRHLNNYKYQVEDVLHELNYEDSFNEEESVIVLDNLNY